MTTIEVLCVKIENIGSCVSSKYFRSKYMTLIFSTVQNSTIVSLLLCCLNDRFINNRIHVSEMRVFFWSNVPRQEIIVDHDRCKNKTYIINHDRIQMFEWSIYLHSDSLATYHIVVDNDGPYNACNFDLYGTLCLSLPSSKFTLRSQVGPLSCTT